MNAQITVNRLPLHIEISEMLARDIEAGVLPVGTRLAPEREMAKELGVSVGTLRKALLDLSEKNMIERVQGSGNYVRKPSADKASKTIYNFFRLELINGGGLPTSQIFSFEKIKKPSSINMFSNSPNVYRIRRLRRLNGEDAAIEEIWLDAPEEREMFQEDISDSLYLYYRETLGFWIDHVEDRVSFSKLPDWKPATFGEAEDDELADIWGYIERKSYDNEGECCEYSKTWFNPQTTRYVSRIK